MAKQEPQWWAFSGSNLQSRYGYGSESQALRYLGTINKDREINLYGYTDATGYDESVRDDGFDLFAELTE